MRQFSVDNCFKNGRPITGAREVVHRNGQAVRLNHRVRDDDTISAEQFARESFGLARPRKKA